MANPKQVIKSYKASWPSGYKFNLPPHSWSLPVPAIEHEQLPSRTRNGVINRGRSTTDRSRRGRIWRYADLANLVDSSDPTVSSKWSFWSAVASNASSFKPNPFTVGSIGKKILDSYKQSQQSVAKDSLSFLSREKEKYGFQFMWNPTTYTTSTGISFNVTPSATDSLAFLNMFQGTGAIRFEIELNRINDFACFKSKTGSNFSQFYGPLWSGNNSDYGSLIADLKNRGTLADLEYLYKTVNGPYLKNVAQQDTSDVGILIPTLVRVDIGPYTQVGYISNLTVTHKMFTQDMIPIHSTVTIDFSMLSSYGFGNQDPENAENVGNPTTGTEPKTGLFDFFR
jgi:hypothetical protein